MYRSILFGGQLTSVAKEELRHIRSYITSESDLQGLHDVMIHFEEYGERLELADSALKKVETKKTSSLFSRWINGDDSLIADGVGRHSNALASALTVLHQVLLVKKYSGRNAPDQNLVEPDTILEGLCIGKMAATVIRLSWDGARMASILANALRLAFCIGVYVDLDRHLLGPQNETVCLLVKGCDNTHKLEQVQDILLTYDKAYLSVVQKSKWTITVGKAQKAELTRSLNDAGFKVVPFDIFGRFHCKDMSWAVKKILELSSRDQTLQLVSSHALKPLLASILSLPENWSTDISYFNDQPEDTNASYVLLVGQGTLPNTIDKTGFRVIVADTMSKANRDQGPLHGTSLSGFHIGTDHFKYLPDSAVAVTGMACNFSGADSLDEFWDILESGRVMCQDLPTHRFPDAAFERRSYPKIFKANVLENVDAFDHKFFNVSRREAAFMDPQQRLALQVTYQALESAGYFSRSSAHANQHVGCYIGACTNEYYENVCTHPPSAFSLTGSIRPFIAGKLSNFFGWTGPAIIYDTACAASGTAIHQACRAIATGEISEAVAGGVNIFVSPDTFQNLSAGHFISRTGLSKTFDKAADGYCRGEGVAIVTLKRLSDALRDGDLIRGVIASTAVGQNANQTSITVPHGPSQMSLYRKALRAACLDAREISYIEAHGTGTPIGDPIEVESIRGVFGDYHRDENDSTYLGSLKSNIGHTEATSGVSGLIKVMLMMEKKMIPRQAFLNELNPVIKPFGSDGIQIPSQNVPWKTEFKAACVNNYGASGSNAVMIVTEPPNTSAFSRDTSGSEIDAGYPISITAFSAPSLLAYLSALLKYINFKKFLNNDSTAHIAYHLSRYRNPALPFSLCTTVSSLDDLKNLCASAATLQLENSTRKAQPVVLLFGGQAGKRAHVPKALYESCAVFRKHLHECDTVIRSLGITSIFPDIFDRKPHDDIIKLHLAIFCSQYCSAMSWLDCGLKPTRLIGHSFGQLTALCVSGVLSLQDSLRFVSTRACYIRDHRGNDPGLMIAIEADFTAVSSILLQNSNLGLEIACHNGPQSLVVAGPTSSVHLLESFLRSIPNIRRWKRLDVTNAFHSVLCDPVLDLLRRLAEQLDFHEAELVLEPCSKENNWKTVTPDLMVSHNREPVYFSQAVNRIDDQLGPCVWLEVGSESALPILKRALGKRASSHHLKSLALDAVNPMTSLAELTSDLWSLKIHTQYWPFHHLQQQQYAVLNLPPYHITDRDGTQRGPLKLVKETEYTSEFLIDTKCSEWYAAFSEYRIIGLPNWPLSFILALVLKGLGMIQSGSTGGSLDIAIHQLNSHILIPSHQEKPLILDITHDDDRIRNFTIASVGDDDTTTYASGLLSLSFPGNELEDKFRYFRTILDISHMKSLFTDHEADSARGRGVYNSLAPLIQISKQRQHTKEISYKGTELVAYISLQSNKLSFVLEDFIQVPLICLNGLRDRPDDELYINTAIGSAYFYYPFLHSSVSRDPLVVFSKFIQIPGEKATCNIFVLHEQSDRLCAAIMDVEFTKMHLEILNGIEKNLTEHTQNPTQNPTTLQTNTIAVAKDADDFQEQQVSTSHDREGDTKCTRISKITGTLYDVLARVADLDVTRIRADLPIADLDIDSLISIEVASEIQDTFGISISFQEFTALSDVGELCRFIEDRASEFEHEEKTEVTVSTDTTNGPDVSTSLHVSDKTWLGISNVGGSDTTYTSTPSSTESALESPYDIPRAFNIVRRTFDAFAKETGCEGFWSNVYPDQTSLVTTYIIEAFTSLNCDITKLGTGDAITNLPLLPKTRLVRPLMCILRDEGFLREVSGRWVRTSKPIANRLPSTEHFEKILGKFPRFAIEHRLLHAVGTRLQECLMGELDPVSLLFGHQKNRKLMADQYLLAPIQSSVSKQLAEFIKQCFGSKRVERTLRVMEIGGGTCGTTTYAIDAFSKLGIPVEYTFTDISQSFVSAAKAKLRDHKFVVFRTLDVTQIPTPDLERRLFNDGRDHAIMDEQAWKLALEYAGFANVDWSSDESEESNILRLILAC
ncbi:ketoacyl-synt-domain-containing protein [Periconia macrospinosa]|uniref:Ketoacyl-synt-domain-containing protein n=1 Tax=Periconia macrospinosa TaxID=97972 RepID=A0A2V1E3C9_9PLEO|nr:ketoacyl-synt-domain-containing protein [Periconia macrospinosa]